MKRTVYYVWYATSGENQNGTHHKSKPFTTEKEAQVEANLKWEGNDYVSIEKVHEEHTGYDWSQQDGTEIEVIEVV